MYLIMGIGETEYVLAFPASPSQPQGSTVTHELPISRKYLAQGPKAVHHYVIYVQGLLAA